MGESELYLTATAEARPKPFVYPLKQTALIVLKMQKEFICEGGFGNLLGNDVAYAQEVVPNVQRLINIARKNNIEVIHTKECHKGDLSDLPFTKLSRTKRRIGNLTIGDKGKLGRILVEGEEGNDIVPECYPLPHEKVITTASKGVLYDTDLHEYCMKKGIIYIILAGLVTEVGVHLVMRELNDRGFESCLVEDCTASYFPPVSSHKNISFDMIIAQGGIIGWTTGLKEIVHSLKNAKPEKLPAKPDWIANVPILLPPNPFFPLSKSLLHGHDKSKEKFVSISNAIPYEFTFPLKKTVCIIIDMQRDFILEGGFGSTLGNQVELLQKIVPNVAFLLATCRKFGIELIHTMEAHLSDLSDCPLAKLTRGGLPEGLRIGDNGKMGRILIREEWGNLIIDENKPLPGEKILFKPGKGAFYQTDLHEYLLSKDITHILFAGVTTEVCVQTSMREANDRGFECLMVSDCTESYFPEFKTSTLEMLTNQGAIVGWSATSTELSEALNSELNPEKS